MGIREALEDCHIAGYSVPRDALLLVNIWKLHRDPTMWSNPDEFCPERFLKEHEKVDIRGQNFRVHPFQFRTKVVPGRHVRASTGSSDAGSHAAGFQHDDCWGRAN
ncbi:hypothetical protein CDL15_Pgr005314 [Punica granatum]|nr:hypothetical protein CDL15_Pgr005314 [Punica granatum]PKI36645.1 hypothetical protein CRG98_042971 [Punica granatum]